MGVTIDDARAIAATLPRSYETVVRDSVRFRVGQIVYAAFSDDDRIMGFGFPKEEREALVASEPDKFLLPRPSLMRYRWVCVRLEAIDAEELRELLVDAWRMVVPKKVAAAYEGRWDGDEYQARFDRLAAGGQDVHGEATFVRSYGPATVLDAGCGTGRVAIELARHGLEVVGVDVDESMLATARRREPRITWVAADLTGFDLARTFDVVVMAGNVPLFTPPGTEAALVTHVAHHVAPGGLLIAGFSLDRGYSAATYDDHAAAAGLTLVERFATWDRAPWSPGGAYAVSVHRR